MNNALKALFDVADSAAKQAYAPYSKFSVGAAIRTPSGDIISGCNVENAAYPAGTCAEAGAIAAMVAAGETRITEIARMLGGKLDSARSHAEALLSGK